MARWGDTWVQFRFTMVAEAGFEDAAYFGTYKDADGANLPFYRKFKVECYVSNDGLGDQGRGIPIPVGAIQKFPGSDPVTGLNTFYFTYLRSGLDAESLQKYVDDTIDGIVSGAGEVTVASPDGFHVTPPETAGLRSQLQVAVVEHVRDLHAKGIGFLFTPKLAEKVGCTPGSLSTVLDKLVNEYHRLAVVEKSFASLSACYSSKGTFTEYNFYTLASQAINVGSLAAKTNEVREAINVLAAGAVHGGAIDWVKFVGMEQFTRSAATARHAAIGYQSKFAKALFDMVMTRPNDPMWNRPDSPLK
ncbi:MAG: hypothetical protein Q6370_009070 [Candidatus Sigynarchaeota archaeon]